jgi:sulfoxide reductase heme-binding subunit YedZ
VIDQGFDFQAIAKDVLKHKFIFLGMGTWLLLLPLAVTSTGGWQRRLGFRRWKRLHRLVYLAGGLASFHFLLRFKTPRLETLAWMSAITTLLLVRAVAAARRRATMVQSP